MIPAVPDDCRLLETCRAGNRQAFGQIIERYQSLICAVTYNLTGDLALSEDLAQETFLAAWQRLCDLREPAKLRAWLCSIARNRFGVPPSGGKSPRLKPELPTAISLAKPGYGYEKGVD